MANTTEPTLDLDAYQAQTDDLVASMQETTDLLTEMSDNMSELSDSFESFGQTKERLRAARTDVQRSQPSVAAD